MGLILFGDYMDLDYVNGSMENVKKPHYYTDDEYVALCHLWKEFIKGEMRLVKGVRYEEYNKYPILWIDNQIFDTGNGYTTYHLTYTQRQNIPNCLNSKKRFIDRKAGLIVIERFKGDIPPFEEFRKNMVDYLKKEQKRTGFGEDIYPVKRFETKEKGRWFY